jgi:hypothetical protein
MNTLTEIKADAIALLAEKTLGVRPKVDDMGTYAKIYYLPGQLPVVQEKFDSLVSSDKPSDIKIEWFPVVQKIAIKKAFPYVLGILATGFIIGKILK